MKQLAASSLRALLTSALEDRGVDMICSVMEAEKGHRTGCKAVQPIAKTLVNLVAI
jgi:hypothetical protein